MKKFLTIAAIFLLGIGGLSAQSAWEVQVNWSFDVSSTCDEYPSAYGYVVGLTIYDAANGNAIVCNNEYNLESSSANTSNFNSTKVGVEAYCGEYHENLPNLTVLAVVRMYDLTTNEQFCVSKNYLQSGYSCNDFSSNGVAANVIFE